MAKAIFWDLQGTLGGDATGSIEFFKPYPFAGEALKTAHHAGYLNLILTNQSKIGKGELSREIYNLAESHILRTFHPYVDAIYCCPHTSKDNCDCKNRVPVWFINVPNATISTSLNVTLSAIWEKMKSSSPTMPDVKASLS